MMKCWVLQGLPVSLLGLSIWLLAQAIYQLSRNASAGMLALSGPKLLLGGAIPLAALLILGAIFGSVAIHHHRPPSPEVEPEATIGWSSKATHRQLSALISTGIGLVLVIAFLAASQYGGEPANVQGKLRDWWVREATTADLLRIQNRGSCCGFTGPSDHPQEPCRGAARGCLKVLADAHGSVLSALEAPAIAALVCVSLLAAVLTVMLIGAKRKARVARRTIRQRHETDPKSQLKTIFQ